MRKVLLSLALIGLVIPYTAQAVVTATVATPITSAQTAVASSPQFVLFSLTLSQTASESLSSVTVTIANAGSSIATGSDIASVSVYKDSNNNGSFDSGTDLVAGTQTTANVGAETTIITGNNNTVDGGKFFVTMATSSTWSASSPADSVTVALAANGIVASVNSPTITALTTATITATVVTTPPPPPPSPTPPPPAQTPPPPPSDDDDDDDDNDEDSRKKCTGGVVNGRLYKVKGSTTVYLVAGCRFKPFRGAAVFHARGHKFINIIELDALPAGVTVSDKPALPAEGTLVKGDKDKTVWFVTKSGKRRGFTREEIFRKLGFRFDRVEIISQSDLDTMPVDSNIDNDQQHPDGAIIKCENATIVFQVKSGHKHAFTSAESFNALGHQFRHILTIKCEGFTYQQGANVE